MKLSILFCLISLVPARPLPAQNPANGSASSSAAETDLAALEAAYAEDRAVFLRRLLARYVDELGALESTMTAAGDQAGAARVRLEYGRVLPALGLPEVAAENSEEFSAFEEGAVRPEPVAPLILPKDLDAILLSLQPARAAASSGGTSAEDKGKIPAAPGSPALNRSFRRVLRMTTAQLTEKVESSYPWMYWMTGSRASWNLNDLPVGSYQLVLRYACDELHGGTLAVSFGESKIETKLAPTGSWKRRREVVIGPFEIKSPRADLLLKVNSVNPTGYSLMDFHSVLIQPADPSRKP